MTESDATEIVAALAAAWPREWSFVDPLTKTIYLQRIVSMPRPRAAQAAVNALIDTEQHLPTVAQIREEYRRHHERFAPLELSEPDLTDADRKANIRRAGSLRDHLAGAPGHDGTFDACPHAGCAELRDLSVPGAGQT